MSGIVAIELPDKKKIVRDALSKISHRGNNGPALYETEYTTQGQIWPAEHQMQPGTVTRQGVVFDGAIYNWKDLCPQASSVHNALETMYAANGPGFVKELDGPFAIVMASGEGLFVARGALGVAPLYEGRYNGVRCFASEIKALLGWVSDIREFPPGDYHEPGTGTFRYRRIKKREPMAISSEDASIRLLTCLERSVQKRVALGGDVGAWLSGGLDSSTMAALARLQLSRLQTFAVGTEGAPDLECARAVAKFIDSEHHEMVVSLSDALRVLPEVIYHLESFDALLVRSSVMNFLVGKLAADHVPSAFSGEGGDELFAGYEYLREFQISELADELVDITNRLHNTALQRVDRCSAAHGLTVHTGFLDRAVVNLALHIPPEYKMWRNHQTIEKWILRKAMYGLLPDWILERPKAKFWEGAGMEDLLALHANDTITDSEFLRERELLNGSTLNTKEELMYYRIFESHFGRLDDLSFVGRTKGAPVTQLSAAGGSE